MTCAARATSSTCCASMPPAQSPSNMFDEDWPRFVVKMATGAGKTKVLSLLIAWSYFHKLYEADSALARNFLLIAPNIIVLDRLRADFDGLRIFFNDPVLPDNGHAGRNWRDDFQIALHIQDDVRVVRADGQYLPHQHPPRLSRRSAGAFARRRRPARLLPRAVRPKARRQDHRQQHRSRRDRARDRRTRRVQ